MCGIVGKLNFSAEPVATQTITAMRDRISHRGPDDEGMFVDGNLGLGFCRLAIIDLSPRGSQPMSDAKEDIWLVFNGEIYNFLTLRKELEYDGVHFRSNTDSEVIIYLYKKYGVNCLQYLRGMFAFAIWDRRSHELFLARDRLGKKPLKYYRDGKTFIFASELKAILVNPEVPKKVDWGAIDEYLSYQFVPHPKTGFLGIEKLEPAHYLLVKETGEIQKIRYWQLDFLKKEQRSEEEWKELIIEVFRESVRIRLMSDVPLGVHLSGGIDSSLVVAFMASQMSGKVKTFSIGFTDPSHNELPHARLVAERFATDHHEFVIESDAIELLAKIAYQYEEPFADSSALPAWILCELTHQYVTVALNGDGGDENFAGYARYKAMQRYELLKAFDSFVHPINRPLARISHEIFRLTGQRTFRYASSLISSYSKNRAQSYLQGFGFFREDERVFLYSRELKNRIQSSRGISIVQQLFEQSSDFDRIEQMMFVDINSYLPDDLLVKTDIASMAHALEVRSPFLDHVFMEQVASMPVSLKLRNRQSKYLLKEIAKDMIPRELIQKPKRGFTIPLEQWLRTSLYEFTRERLLDPTFLRYGFNRASIETLLDRHMRGEDYSRKLWTLLMLRLWLREWFKR